MGSRIVQIIEDEPLHADLLDRALRQAQFATTLAADGESGWRDAQRLLPSLILLDLMLPGLSGQADDYVVKPFSPREVVSRVQTVLRRVHETRREDPVLFSDTSITMEGPYFVLTLQERQITVSNTELRLLQYLLPRNGELVRGDELLNLPGEELGSTSREELEHRVRFLRRKLENSGTGSIEILPGSRYRFLAHPGPT
jgi:DNA-binding response OmpR family regulator